MDQALIDRIRTDMAYEYDRTAPPDGFPRFHDIPVGRHISDTFEALEQKYMWPRAWGMACRAEDIPEPGDYIVFTDIGVPLLIVRGTDGEIRCFYNTCQHRGAPVVREDRCSSRRLRCQYHSWTYEIDGGKLVALPDERDFVDFDWEARCLPRASCDVFGGFVFVNRDLDATPLASWIGPAAEMFTPFECESLREMYRESVIVPCNWKVAVEAFLEVYHFKHIHSHNGVSILDNRGAAMGLYQNGHSRMITPFSEQNQQRVGMTSWDDWKHVDHGQFPSIDGVPPMVDCSSTSVSLFPNIIIPLGRSGFPINLFWPIHKSTTRLDWIYYAPVDGGAHAWGDGELSNHWRIRRDQYHRIMDKDMMKMAPIQKSMESPALTGITTNCQERRIWHMHEQIDRIIGVEQIPPGLRVEPLLGPYIES